MTLDNRFYSEGNEESSDLRKGISGENIRVNPGNPREYQRGYWSRGTAVKWSLLVAGAVIGGLAAGAACSDYIMQSFIVRAVN